MKRFFGKVVEVFIPEQYRNGGLLDVMDRTLIGFRVETDEGIKEVVQEQDEFNAEIMKDDMVMITEQVVDGNYFIDIELVDGDDYE